MNTINNAWHWFINDNGTAARLTRTIVEGILGVIAAAITVLVAAKDADPLIVMWVGPVVIAIITPIISMLRTKPGINDGKIEDEE